MGKTELKSVDSMDLAGLAEEALEEVYAGAPDRFSDAGPESPVIEHQEIDNPIDVDADDKMLPIVNVSYDLPLLEQPEEEPGEPTTPVGADLAPVLKETSDSCRF